MEGAGAGSGFRKELVSRLLHLHFKDDKTKVSGDALQLMVELLKVFVVGEPRAHAPSGHSIRNFAFFQRENQDVFSRFPQGPKLGSPEPVCQVLWPGSGGCPWVLGGAPAQAEALTGLGFKIPPASPTSRVSHRRSSSPRRAAGPGRRRAPCGRGPAGEGASAAGA
eukprot:XP_016879815.1 centromere protein X isoform X1 [Homo sapiens]